MKRTTIWIIATLMGAIFIVLLYLQVSYLREVLDMRREQFDESVNRSINRVSMNMEFEETRRGLINDAKNYMSNSNKVSADDTTAARLNTIIPINAHFTLPPKKDSTAASPLEKMPGQTYTNISKDFLHQGPISTFGTTKELQSIIKKRYVFQQSMLNRVIYSILSEANDKPLNERLDFKSLDRNLKFELANNGINLPYHFKILTRDGHEIYKCPDYDSTGENYAFTRILFPNDPPEYMTIIKLHFPDRSHYILNSIRFIVPALIFTLLLLAIFIVAFYLIFRQSKYTEMKNDFINNMTHEFKTPISTISLAAQMLADPSVAKNGKMFDHLSGVINDETKRLRFQVEKVLQVSLYDRNKAKYNKKELDLNTLIADVAHTYIIKVKNAGGTLTTDLAAKESTIFADEMHITNVIFNLLDNAMKYRRDNVDLELNISTKNEGSHIIVMICDNGIGIHHEDLHKIFDRFYRVHTGNRHDVKGFGLGLAYVKSIIDLHEGNIHAESEFGQGTKFIISLPIIKKQN